MRDATKKIYEQEYFVLITAEATGLKELVGSCCGKLAKKLIEKVEIQEAELYFLVLFGSFWFLVGMVPSQCAAIH